MTPSPLRRGWTTGACAAAGARAAYQALLTGAFPDPVTVHLPRGQSPAFALARCDLSAHQATVSIIKDGGDDPDVTHGAEVVTTLRPSTIGSGVTFAAGPGVGTVTKPGLPLAVGEPAINLGPRALITAMVEACAQEFGGNADVLVEVAIPGGQALARKTWNPGLGIKGGLSILGTTGVVIPYSCAAWIHSIHRGIDVARATGVTTLIAGTGATSLRVAKGRHPDATPIEMGDFAGGMFKYLRRHPVKQVILCGGFAKLSKLAVGYLDLHSGRSRVDMAYLAGLCPPAFQARVRRYRSAGHALALATQEGFDLAGPVAHDARDRALTCMDHACDLAVWVVDRAGNLIGQASKSGA